MNMRGARSGAGSGPTGFTTATAALLGALALLAVMFLTVAAPAGAVNTRVSISDFLWSDEPTVDLGESVTWDWIGPDLQHSVTGQAPNATQWDSDPNETMPLHQLGSSYAVTFDQPGEYLFICKIHSSVRGVITVTNNPGDPDSDPGPQAPINFDLEPPFVNEVRLFSSQIGHQGHGTTLEFASDEGGHATVDYYRLVTRGRGKNRRTVRAYAGYSEWETHVGYNYELPFAKRTDNFPAGPGSYVGLLEVTDEVANTTESMTLPFEINQDPKVLQREQARKRKIARRRAVRQRIRRKRAVKRRAVKRRAAKRKAAQRRAAAGRR